MIEDSDLAFYLKAIGSFANFIDEYDLQNFVDKSNKVINLATGCVITTYDEYGFSTEINANYLNSLIERLRIGKA